MRLSELEPHERRTLERRTAQNPKARRPHPDPAKPSRPDLEVVPRSAALAEASRRRANELR